MYSQYAIIVVFTIVGCIFAFGGLITSYLIAPLHRSVSKESPYECGVEPVGQAWGSVKLSYYIYAIVFVIFDIETAFLVPVLVAYKSVSLLALYEVGTFLMLLFLGLLYVWKKGVLTWE